ASLRAVSSNEPEASRADMKYPGLNSEEGVLSLETLQLVFPQRTRRDEIYQLVMCRFAQAAKFAQGTRELFHAKDQIHFLAHQTFLPHRGDPSNRHGPEMDHYPKVRRVLLLQFFQRVNHGGDFFRLRFGIRPIGEKAVAQIFIYDAVMLLDDLLASRDPRSEERFHAFALHAAAERSEIANICDEEPTRDVLNLPEGLLCDDGFVFL